MHREAPEIHDPVLSPYFRLSRWGKILVQAAMEG